MSLMFARRRQEAKKQHETNKLKAHAENHARVKAEHAKTAVPEAKLEVKEEAAEPTKKKAAKDGAQ